MELKDIWVKIGDQPVFQGLNLKSDANRIGVIGRNGAGKSTLLRLLQGLILPERGSVAVERPVGLVFQNSDHQILFPTVLEELSFGLLEKGVDKVRIEEEARRLTLNHGVPSLLGMATHELSAGQRTHLCILAVLIDSPQTLLLDESLSNLDLASSKQMLRSILSFQGRIVFSTHQTHLLRDFEEVIWLDEGRMHLQGPPNFVIDRYETWSLKRAGA